MKPQTLTEELWADWLQHPVTEALRWALARRRQERKDDWEAGETVAFANPEHALRNAAAIGECQGYKFVQEITLETLKQEIEDASEPQRP